MRDLLQTIARGAAWKLGADLLGRALQYVLLWAAARSLGRADFGDFTFGLSVGLMLAQVADFGLQLFVQRELSRQAIPGATARPYFADERAASRLVGGGLAIKSALSVVAMALMAAFVLVEPVGNKGALLLVGFSMVLATGLDYLCYCFRALGRLKNEALAWLLARATNLALGLGVLLVGGGVWGLAVVGNLAMLAAIVFSYRRLSAFVRPAWRVDRPYWRRMLGQPTAIGVGVIFSIISFRVDNLLIPPFSGSGALGLYNVAYKLFEPSQILPATLLAATFPLLSQAHISGGTERSSFKRLLAHNLSILLGLASAITLLIVAFSGPVVNLLYGIQYAGSAPVLRILALACIPMYLNYALTHALTAIDRPRLYAIFTLVTIAINVAANLVLLPTIGIEGAAWATVITEVALFALCALAVFRLLSSTETVGSRQPAAGSSDGQILPTADRLLPAASALSTLTDRLLFGALLLVLAMSPFEAGYRPLSRFFAARLTNLELTLLVLTAAWLLRLVMDSGARSRLIRMPLLAPIVALVGATLFSWAFGEYRALGGNYLYRLLMGTVVCLSAWEALKGTRRALAAVCTLVAVGTVSAALGLLEFAPWVNVGPWLAAFKPMPTTVGGVLRLSGTFEYANGAGMYFEMLLPLALGLAVYFGGRKRGAQFAAFVACAVIMAALLLTFSRAALLGALVALVLFGVTGVLGSRKSAASNAEEILTPGSRFARGRSAPALRSYPSTSTPVLSSLVIALVFMALGAVLIVATQPVFRLRLTSENDSTWYNVTYRPGPVPALAAGEWVTMPVTVRNDGPMIWRADGSVSVHLSYHWLSEDKKQIVYFDGARTRLPRDVGPGETVDLQAALVAPPEAGTYYLQWDMVQENVIWFSAKSSADNEPTRQMVGPPLTGAAEQAAQGGKPFDMPSPVDPGALNNFDAVDRTKLWKVAFAMFRAHPLTGVGPDGFRNLYGPYAGVTDWNKNIYTNNTYVEMFANLGLPGGLAFLALAAVSMWLALRGVLRGPVDGRWALCLGATAGLAAFFFHGFFDYFLFSTPMYAVFWFLLGLAVSSRRQTLTPDPRPLS